MGQTSRAFLPERGRPIPPANGPQFSSCGSASATSAHFFLAAPPLFHSCRSMSSVRRQYPFDLIEPKWQRIWDEQQMFRAWNPGETIPPAQHPFAKPSPPAPAQVLHPRHVPLSLRRRACTSAIPKATPPPTSSPATNAPAASTSFIPWAGTPSACPPNNTPSKQRPPAQNHRGNNITTLQTPDPIPRLQLRLVREVDTTDPNISNGPSGFSSKSTIPGSIPRRTRPNRSSTL
jgi:hypothetical protein